MPSLSRPSSRRPIWWSVYSKKPAYTSMHCVPGRNFLVARGELCVLRNNTESFLSGNGFLAELVPALVELALVLVGPLFRHMVGGVGRAGREVSEKWLVRRQRFLLRYPGHRLIGHIFHEVVTLF